jgi:hypothetical protein
MLEAYDGFNTSIRSLSRIESNVSALRTCFREALSNPNLSLYQKEKLSNALRQIYGSSDSIEVHEGKLEKLYDRFRRWIKHKA